MINRKKQEGVVLLIALIVLIAMSLAGVALNRSVDTAMGIAGNLGFKQSTSSGAGRGVASAIQWITANSAGTTLDYTNTNVGYFSSATQLEPDWKDTNTWTNSMSAGTDASGNTIRYMIHRMCAYPDTVYNGVSGTGQQNQCSMVEPSTFGAAGNSINAGAFQFTGTPQVVFRITARADGPKSTSSVVQTFYTLAR